MSKFIAEFISVILNPLVLLVPLPFFLVYETGGSLASSILWTIITFLFIFLFFVFILFGIWRGFFSDLDVSRRKQRPLLFLVAILLTLVYISILFIFHAPVILYIAAVSVMAGLGAVDMVNSVIKASVHLATLSAVSTFLVIVEGWPFLFAYLLIPVLAWSRIKTKNHTPKETALGTSLGILFTLTVYVIFKYIIHV